MFIALIVVFFLPEEPLRTVSGIQARHEDDVQRASEAAAVSTGSSQMVDGDALTTDDALTEAEAAGRAP